MWLNAATQSFSIILSESENTPSRWWASYRDVATGGATSAPVTVNGQTNGNVSVTIFSGPASGIRELIRFYWLNNDNIAHNATVQLNDNGTLRSMPGPDNIPIKSSLCYHTLKGWYLFPTPTTGIPLTDFWALIHAACGGV